MNSAWREKLAVSLTSVATRLAACNCGKPVGIRWGGNSHSNIFVATCSSAGEGSGLARFGPATQ